MEWDPHSFTILAEEGGQVSFRDIIEGQTVHEQVDENTGMAARVIVESADEKKQPRIEIRDEKGKAVRKYLLPSGAHLMVEDGAAVSPGDVLAKIPRAEARTQDVTGGLPRVVELFEARRPKEPAVITEIDGSVKYGDVTKQHRKIYVTGDDNDQREYQLPRGAHINVQEGELFNWASRMPSRFGTCPGRRPTASGGSTRGSADLGAMRRTCWTGSTG